VLFGKFSDGIYNFAYNLAKLKKYSNFSVYFSSMYAVEKIIKYG